MPPVRASRSSEWRSRSSGSAVQSAISMPRRSSSGVGLEVVEGELDGGREDALAALHEALVAGDAEDPGLEAGGLAELVDAFEHADQGLLRDFLGVLPVAAHEEGVVRQAPAEGADELVERLVAAGEEVAGEVEVGRAGHGSW